MKSCVNSDKVDAIPTVYVLLATQSNPTNLRTHIFSCIVRFPLTPPAKEQSAGEKFCFLFVFYRKREKRKERNRIMRVRSFRSRE